MHPAALIRNTIFCCSGSVLFLALRYASTLLLPEALFHTSLSSLPKPRARAVCRTLLYLLNWFGSSFSPVLPEMLAPAQGPEAVGEDKKPQTCYMDESYTAN